MASSDEAALRALYDEGGGLWWGEEEARRTWLNPLVPACEWAGVTCGFPEDGSPARVVKLVMTGFGLTAISERVAALSELVDLQLDKNSLRTLPDAIGTLAKLRVLWVGFNKLQTGVTPALGSLTALQELDLSNNELEAVPESLGALHNLVLLFLDFNRLRAVPDFFGTLSKLQSVYLDSNQLTAAPPSLLALPALEILTLKYNPMRACPSLGALGSLKELYLSGMGLAEIPEVPPSLTRLDVHGNDLKGVVRLCLPDLKILNINDNPLMGAVNTTCLASLESVNAAHCNLTSVEFLGGSPGLAELDVSHNPFLGMAPFRLAKAGAWPRLLSFRAASTGLAASVADVLASVHKIRTLYALDASGNSGVDGEITIDTFRAAGIYPPEGLSATFPLIILRLDGTSLSFFGTNHEFDFPSLRVLSLRNTSQLMLGSPVTKQQWLNLEEFDIRGANPELDIGGNVTALPGAPINVDLASKSSCPGAVVGGTVSKYAIMADPGTYNWSLCECLDNHYGEPSKGCIECPEPPRGETGVGVDCHSVPGAVNLTGGWFRFSERDGAVEVVACPSDSPRSPCKWVTLRLSIRTHEEWRGVAAKFDRECVDGYEGRLCSKCKAGFFRSGRSCYRCGARGLSWLNPLWSLILLSALGVKSVAGGHRSRSGMIRTLILHAQLVALLPDMSLRLSGWPGFFAKSSGSGAGGLRLNGLECEDRIGWDGFYGPFVQSALLPVFVAIGSAWIGLISGYVSRGKAMPLLARLRMASLYLWLVLLFGSMQHLMAPLNCTDYGSSEGRRYLVSALWIACSGPSYRGLLAASVVLGLGYTLGTIAFVVYKLRPGSTGASPASLFLRSPYTPECYFWEAVQLVRRVALAMASSLTKLNSPLQPVIVSSVLIMSLFAHTWRKPYVRPIDNVVESISLTLLLSSYMAGLIASNPHFPPSATTSISWLFFAFNAVFLVALTLTVLFRAAQTGLQKFKDRTAKEEPLLEMSEREIEF
jgi:hypothetical protein